MTVARCSRRAALASGFAAPHFLRASLPSETVRHASFGAAGMAGADIGSLAAGKHLQLVAVADVDLARTAEIKKRFPQVRVYQDWRELLDQEKGLDSVNVSTPDHMHAPIAMRAMRQGLHVYGQKPLTQTIHEARRLTEVAAERKLVTQMGIQIHSHGVHRTVVAMIQDGLIGKVKEVHSWSGKQWGDRGPRPERRDVPPATLAWNQWLGVAPEQPYLKSWCHPGDWRKRLDFGTGTFGDMGCHILDPVFGALALGMPNTVRSEGDAPNAHSWGLDVEVRYEFPGTKFTTEKLALTWRNGKLRPPHAVAALVGGKLSDQGSVYVGTDGVLYSPYIGPPVLLPAEKFAGRKLPALPSEDHYQQFVEAVRGRGQTSAPFSYAGPLTEMVLLGCLATRFPQTTLAWDGPALKITNNPAAHQFVRKTYRKGWEVEGL